MDRPEEHRKEREKLVIKEFVRHLAEMTGVPVDITCWPDEEERKKKEIDAIAEGGGHSYAIEHTSIDRVLKQRESDAAFDKHFGPLEKALIAEFGECLDGIVRILVPWRMLQKGESWDAVVTSLKLGLCGVLPTLEYGNSRHTFPGVEPSVTITKRQSDQHRIMFSRGFNEDDAKDFNDRLLELIDRKAKKYDKYNNGERKLLLIENSDGCLFNMGILTEGVENAVRSTTRFPFDEVWFADSSFCSDTKDIEYRRVWPAEKPA